MGQTEPALCVECGGEFKRAEQPAGVVAWQPIETAPKNGTRVLLWAEGAWSAGMFEGGEWCCAPDGYPPIPKPTHWAIPNSPVMEPETAKAERLAAHGTQAACETAALGWQPIETAPKDGSWVLLSGGKTTEYDYSNDHVRFDRPVTAFWSEENGWAFCYWDGMWREAYKDPTHWCRLP